VAFLVVRVERLAWSAKRYVVAHLRTAADLHPWGWMSIDRYTGAEDAACITAVQRRPFTWLLFSGYSVSTDAFCALSERRQH
jgi:hypothetical protein